MQRTGTDLSTMSLTQTLDSSKGSSKSGRDGFKKGHPFQIFIERVYDHTHTYDIINLLHSVSKFELMFLFKI
jgi:hypothetical protein